MAWVNKRFSYGIACRGRARLTLVPVVGLLLLACHPVGNVAQPGEIALAYDHASQSELFFILENRSAQAIHVRGTKGISADVAPVDIAIICSGGKSQSYDDSGFPLVDSAGTLLPNIAVAAGEQVHLRIGGAYYNAAVAHRGGSCSVRPRLQDRTEIESKQFKP
jgi:hypothetical protein